MIIYIDNEYKCYTEEAEGLQRIETDCFNDKCKEFIEGYRYLPEGEEWTREDGTTFYGLMISPWKDYNILEKAQMRYEIEQLKIQNAEYESALSEIEEALGV